MSVSGHNRWIRGSVATVRDVFNNNNKNNNQMISEFPDHFLTRCALGARSGCARHHNKPGLVLCFLGPNRIDEMLNQQ
jgi:hypothetical protein